MPPAWIACHDCDLLHRYTAVPEGGAARCRRCDAVLYRQRANSLERTLALTIAGSVLFIVANALPFLSFEMQGRVTETTLASGVRELHAQGMTSLAGLVALTAIGAPAAQLGMLLYVLLPLSLGRRPWRLARVFRMLRHVEQWSMMEVFLIGILVALVKLVDMANIIPGIALVSFAMLIIVLAGAASTLDPREVWRHVEVSR